MIICNGLLECYTDVDGILKFKRAVTVAVLSYIEYFEHFRSHAEKKQHHVLENVGSADSQPCTSSRGIEEKTKKKNISRKKALFIEKPKIEVEEERPLQN